MNLDHSVAKKVWIYEQTSSGEISLVNSSPISSRMETAKLLGIQGKTLIYYLDSSKPVQGGYFLFSRTLRKKL